MSETVYAIVGAVIAALAMYLAKVFGSSKGDPIDADDSKRMREAAEKAARLIGERAYADRVSDEDRKRIDDKLKIEDPSERLESIAEELIDL